MELNEDCYGMEAIVMTPAGYGARFLRHWYDKNENVNVRFCAELEGRAEWKHETVRLSVVWRSPRSRSGIESDISQFAGSVDVLGIMRFCDSEEAEKRFQSELERAKTKFRPLDTDDERTEVWCVIKRHNEVEPIATQRTVKPNFVRRLVTRIAPEMASGFMIGSTDTVFSWVSKGIVE